MSGSTSANLFEGADVYNTLYPGLVGSFFIFFIGIFACLILACAQTSHSSYTNRILSKIQNPSGLVLM